MIEAQGLGKQFHDFWAVRDLTIKVNPGQILALLGQNGAGKTTTVRMLTSLLSPTRGWASVNGFDVASQGDQVRASVGVLTEQHGLYIRMTGTEYLDFFGKAYGLDIDRRRGRSSYLLDYFGLASSAGRRIGEYSKGMRQKLALARSLMHEPPVLLLDEPTSAMDPESARLVRDEIARLRSTQRTIVICTHNLAEAEILADIIAVIYEGRILIQGTMQELKQKVLGGTEFEAKFSMPWKDSRLKLPQGVWLTGQEDIRMQFRIDDPGTLNPVLMRELSALQAPMLAFQEVPHTLEQVYLKIMAEAESPEGEPVHA